MGRKGKNSALEQRVLVLQLYIKFEKYKKIGELLNVKSNTVGDIVRRFRNEGRERFTEHEKMVSAQTIRRTIKKVVVRRPQ